LDTGASHSFITRESVERIELHLEELKVPIEVHFPDEVPHPTTLQARDVPLHLGNWRGNVDLLVFTLGGMECIWEWNSSPLLKSGLFRMGNSESFSLNVLKAS
jgi:hypothetical protein